ncbi:MAG: GWxTD domain-containing protein [Bacteroidales bacterium]|nr:GWxTD domain-containing protein [Bacteroidales bacterium]
MRKYTLLIIMLMAVASGFSQGLKALISHKGYCTSNLQPYIEFTFVVGGNTVRYVPDGKGGFEAGVEIRVEMQQNDTVVKQLHYILGSDRFADSTRSGKPDFADIQNVQLPQGEYFLYFYMKDVNALPDSTGKVEELAYIDKITLDFPEDRISTSKISLYKSVSVAQAGGLFVKYGFDLPPLYSNFVPESQYTLPFALEVYNTPKILGNRPLTAKCYVEQAESHLAANPSNIITMTYPPKEVVLVFNEFNVFNLPSGNYFAVVQLLDDRDSLLLVDKVFFQKSNPSVQLNLEEYSQSSIVGTFVEFDTNRKELIDMVKCLYPISSITERDFYENRLKTTPTEQLQQFFYNFWLRRNPANPEEAWNNYKKRVDEVQKMFGSKQIKGYLTDRGRVYLQYGRPDEVKDQPSDPVTLPYQIWQYYYLNNQTNVKFVFYDPVMTGKDYELLHSTMYGEFQNPNWKMQLVRKIQTQQDLYDTEPVNYWGNEMDDYWKYH